MQVRGAGRPPEGNSEGMTIDKIEQIAPGVLNPWARNARTHSRQQIRQIADSIETFGFTNPVLIDSIGPVLAGHGRVEAAKLLGLQRVPCRRIKHLSAAEKGPTSSPTTSSR